MPSNQARAAVAEILNGSVDLCQPDGKGKMAEIIDKHVALKWTSERLAKLEEFAREIREYRQSTGRV